MNTSKDNVQLMIEAFTNFRDADDHSEKATDNLLRCLLDHSVVPTYQDYRTTNQADRDHELNPITDEERVEINELNLILSGDADKTADANNLWESYDELMALVTTYPPILLEQLLIIGMVVYLMRANNTDFDSDTDAFTEFYHGWGSVARY